jgi:hypothetical protein
MAGEVQRGLAEIAMMAAARRAGYHREDTDPIVYDSFCNGYRIGTLTAENPVEARRQLKEAYNIPDHCEKEAFIRGHEAGALDGGHGGGGGHVRAIVEGGGL